jgi:hypothetical protein
MTRSVTVYSDLSKAKVMRSGGSAGERAVLVGGSDPAQGQYNLVPNLGVYGNRMCLCTDYCLF